MELGFVVVAGHICLDIIPNMENVPEVNLSTFLKPGHLVITGPAGLSTGGPVSNTGLALYQLGIPTRLIAKVGKDALGGIVRGIVEKYDPALACGLTEGDDAPTSYTFIISAPEIDRIFFHCPGANDTFCADDISYDLVSAARLFHFGYPPVMRRMYSDEGKGLVEVFQKAKATGATTSLDMTFPDAESDGGKANWTAILQKVLPYVDVFMPSFAELLFMLRRDVYEKLQLDTSSNEDILTRATPELISSLGEEILAMGAKMAVIKLGERGLYLRTSSPAVLEQMGRGAPANLNLWGDAELWTACFQVNVVGTTGAGDSTIAGFLGGLMRGSDPIATLTAAVAVGACAVEAADALSGLCTWEDTMARVEGGWKHLPLDLNPAGWQEIKPGMWKK